MSYTPAQAKRLATQIFTRFGKLLRDASTPIVPEDFLAGFVGVECGKDKRGRLVPEATRFEPHVYRALIAIRDTGKRGRSNHYNFITQKDLAGRSDTELRALATSHGPAQIMGWHTVRNLKAFSIPDLSDPDLMFLAASALLEVVAKAELRAGRMSNALRIWNTGKPDGKTYHEDYVPNAQAVSAAYRLAREAGPEEVLPSKTASGPQSGAPANGSTPVTDPPPGSAPDSEGAPSAGPAGEQTITVEAGGSAAPVVNVFNQAGAGLEKLEGLASEVGKRADSVKSIQATIGGSVFQILVAVGGFFLGIPRSVWIAVLVFGGLLALAFLIRQIYLGGIREKKAD